MDCGVLIERAWRLAWRNRFLWVLGLFATSTVGSCSPLGGGSSWQADSSDLEQGNLPDTLRPFQDVDPWLSQNIAGIFITIAVVAALIGLTVMVVSLAAQGGMAIATSDLALGHRATGRDAWRVGFRLFWRYLLLWLILLGLVLAVVLVTALVIGMVVAAGAAMGGPNALIAVLALLLGIPAVVAGIVISIAGSVVAAFAQRAIAVEGLPAWASLGVGYRLVRRDFGKSALAWLVNLALSFGAVIVIGLAAIPIVLALGALGAGIYALTGASATFVLYVVVALVALIAALWFLGGIANAFFWNYWTLVYLRLTGRLTERLEPVAQE
jgi:hypothetical protein